MRNDVDSSLWAATAPPRPPAPRLEGARRCDVVVVGGGFTGLSAALRLAEAGASVVALEARGIGHGGSGRNSGLVNAGLWLPNGGIRERLGAAAEPLIAALQRSPDAVFDLIERHGIGCEATRNGTLWCALDDAGLRKAEARAAQVNADGARTVMLGAAEAMRRLGSRRVRGALLDPDAGTIQPMAFVRGLATAAERAGAELHADSPATEVERVGHGWEVRTPGGSVRADRAIVAVNAYGAHAWRDIARSQIPMQVFHLATEPLGAEAASILPGGEGAWSAEAVLSIWRRDAAGRLILGSIGRAEGAVHRDWCLRMARRMFPALPELRIAHAWTGRVAVTPSRLPAFHEPAPGIVAASGYNGRGIGPGVVFGQALADHALGRSGGLPLPLAAPPPAALRGLRGVLLDIGAAAAHAFGARLAGGR